MNYLYDYWLGYYILSDMAGRALFLNPPRATTLLEIFENGTIEEYLASIGFEFVDDEDQDDLHQPRKFGEREEFDRSKIDLNSISYPKLKIRKIRR